jgi:hypothetical protein
VSHNLPFLLGLLWRERGLRLQLPQIALLSLKPSQWPDLLGMLREAISYESWKRLYDVVSVPVLRLYGHRHVKQWMHQARSQNYIKKLRRLMQPQRQPAR